MFDNKKVETIEKQIAVLNTQMASLGNTVAQLSSYIITISDSLQNIREDIKELQEHKCQCKEKVDIKTTDKIQLNETEQPTESKPDKFKKYGTSA